ncbi:hypothetical protein GE061_018629 [Apolygus lucorum]|uniref:Late endosomal/lysosomal adaptor and MAPK and MTOR activator 4 n=1 Tax=Apolygus lucorum TaxID=248454 RepID=A0A8S9XGH8_APOLU|nr:hypothetical protein GE061_018629 [Apolygus lucorum]
MKLFERVPDLLGYLVLNEDGAILSSDGDLENAEATANVFTTIIGLTDKLGSDDERYKKLSITFSDCTYIVCLSNRKFFIVKRRFQPPPRPIAADEESPSSGDF